MTSAQILTQLLDDLKVGRQHTAVASRRDAITTTLNSTFRDVDGSTAHSLMVGSYGRHTAIHGVSDLDMIFILPAGERSRYAGPGGAGRVLNRVRDALTARYPRTSVRVDQCVVRVEFVADPFTFEVQPAFENPDGSFSYPDTVADRWKTTKPRAEITATRECTERTRTNMRRLARMTRAWKNANGIRMGGLLIDTLVHRFFDTTDDYNRNVPTLYPDMVRDFFAFLAAEPHQDYYAALGSQQRVTVKKPFQGQASTAHDHCVAAITAQDPTAARRAWREVFGSVIPATDVKAPRSTATTPSPTTPPATGAFTNTEEFIEDQYHVNITGHVTIDCLIEQDGWRPTRLRDLLNRNARLSPDKKLTFTVTTCTVDQPYQVKWKVLNRGAEARRRNEIRGQIIDSTRPGVRIETTRFRGDHVVECYVLVNNTVVARDHITVPIDS